MYFSLKMFFILWSNAALIFRVTYTGTHYFYGQRPNLSLSYKFQQKIYKWSLIILLRLGSVHISHTEIYAEFISI